MEIRRAVAADIPGIVKLLKLSLGEGLMPKSESYWHWKHIDNPFGVSPVIVAVEGDEMVGVRAFMKWNWIAGEKVFSAVRAVDTATHPQHQGKGIFTKLTKALLDDCRASNIHMVFNTPNDKSMPGYLKMGWENAGRLPVAIKILRPVSMGWNFLRRGKQEVEHPGDGTVSRWLTHPGLQQLLRAHRSLFSSHIVTEHSTATLAWRYQTVPVASYHADGIGDSNELRALYFYRLKQSRFGVEFRVTDCFVASAGMISGIREQVVKKAKDSGADYISANGLTREKIFSGLSFTREIGPVVTVRKILADDLKPFLHFNNWNPSVGDLELF